jgi:hypothetical protein
MGLRLAPRRTERQLHFSLGWRRELRLPVAKYCGLNVRLGNVKNRPLSARID